jgi:hypothetical protein
LGKNCPLRLRQYKNVFYLPQGLIIREAFESRKSSNKKGARWGIGQNFGEVP